MMDTSEPAETPARRSVRRRSEFVAAFVEHAGPVPASERRTVTLPTLITVTAVVSLLMVIVGVFTSLIKGNSTKASASTAAAAPSYSEFAGWGCAGATDHGFEADGRTKQWRTVPEGGWSGNGCNSTFETILFNDTATTGGQCRVQVYVPKSTSAADTAAIAVHFAVMAGRTGATYADFTIDEAGSSGQWVEGGSFPLHGNELAVRLTNRGVPQHKGDRIAISAVRVTCGA